MFLVSDPCFACVPDRYGVARAAGWEPYNLLDLSTAVAHVPCIWDLCSADPAQYVIPAGWGLVDGGPSEVRNSFFIRNTCLLYWNAYPELL